jgi:competence protein CoiA
MPFYAFDGERFIYAPDASGQKKYSCLECKGLLKLRKGQVNFPHFYHVKTSPSCRLHGKGDDHLRLQLHLQQKFPEKEAFLEFPFFSIHRIADLVWEPPKIVFEIQCSPLKLSEAKGRVFDYGSLGYQVVWLLDDRLFNQKIIGEAEMFCRSHKAYFVSFSKELIYDQVEEIREGRRLRKSGKFPVDLARPLGAGFAGDAGALRAAPLPEKKGKFFNTMVAKPYLKALKWLLSKV